MHKTDVFKVGQTYRAAEDRVKELYRGTSNPGKFKILASFPVSNRHKAEAAHTLWSCIDEGIPGSI